MWSVLFVFLSYLDRNLVRGDFLSRALDAEKESKDMFSLISDTCCAKTSAVGENFLYEVSDGAAVVLSAVSPAGELINCSVMVNQVLVREFLLECRLEENRGTLRYPQARFTHMDEAKRMCHELRGGVEKDDTGHSALPDKVFKRSKRGFTYPGTLWCGAGNMADHYDQLGEFTETDSCCRTHDHCPHVIHAFSTKYGYTNFKWHSICHCDCDNTLRSCLRAVNDTSSRVVGQAFFNVIGVPCFEFAYEEQCAERHWYGMCKRYEKLPVVVLQEAIPYDYGGIDIIDVLTLAPPKQKDSKTEKEMETTESSTQPTMSGPEEPSLRNVVTAAEDFIKVLATVSTSQSSAAQPDSESQSADKKKKKKEKKKKISKKQKGKGRKRKPNAEAAVKMEEGISPPGTKTKEAIALSNFLSESHDREQSGRSTHTAADRELEVRGETKLPNEIMKDESGTDKETVNIMSRTKDKEKTAAGRRKTKNRRNGRRRRKMLLASTHQDLLYITHSVMNTTGGVSSLSVPSIITITPTTRLEQQSFSEKRPVVTAARTPILIPKVKRNRSKEGGEREGGKKSSDSPFVAMAHENSLADNLGVTPLTGALTVTSVPSTWQQLSHTPDAFGGPTSVHGTALKPSLGLLKRQRSKERGLRNKRRKSVVSSERFQTTPETVLHFPDAGSTPGGQTTTAVSGATERTQSEWSHFTTAVPSILKKRHKQQRKSRKKSVSAVLDREHTPTTLTFTTPPARVPETGETNPHTPCVTTSAVPHLSRIQLSIERLKEQFSRKKRRKAALSRHR